jgi:hypothetical protein
MTAKYDLTANQGSNYNFFLEYINSSDQNVNLAGYSASMQIRRAKTSDYPLVFITGFGSTYGYTGGFTTGYSGMGGISLNTNYTGASLTGGIYIKIDALSTGSLPIGKHFYDLELTIGTTFTNKLVEGRIEVVGETTR